MPLAKSVLCMSWHQMLRSGSLNLDCKCVQRSSSILIYSFIYIYIGQRWLFGDWCVSHKHNASLFRNGPTFGYTLQHQHTTTSSTTDGAVVWCVVHLQLQWSCGGRVSELFPVHLERRGRVSLNRAIFMLTEQNTYNEKYVAKCKETRGNMSRKQPLRPVWWTSTTT